VYSSEQEDAIVRQALAKYGAVACQGYFRQGRTSFGKRRLWYHVVRPLLMRRDVLLDARTCFGAQMRLCLADTIQSYVYFFGVWEPAITAYIMSALAPGDVVIDVGANVGYDALLAAHCVGAAGQVFAIEASPRIFHALQANIALNAPACITALNAAICAAPGDVPVFLHDDSNLGGTTIIPAIAGKRGAIREAMVAGARLTDLVPEDVICRARLIKVDVEGAEWPVVQGFAALLPALSDRTELLIEVSRDGLAHHGMTVGDFLAVFRAAGFSPFLLPNPYRVEAYIDPAVPPPEPLETTAFDQLDLLFRRV